MVAYRNTRTGRVVYLAGPLPSMERSRRWERIAPETTTASGGEASVGGGDAFPPLPSAPDAPLNPAEHTVAQVNAYLADAGRDERLRVLAEEAEGRGRRGILSGPWSDLSGA